jgi:hypothetical protein
MTLTVRVVAFVLPPSSVWPSWAWIAARRITGPVQAGCGPGGCAAAGWGPRGCAAVGTGRYGYRRGAGRGALLNTHGSANLSRCVGGLVPYETPRS